MDWNKKVYPKDLWNKVASKLPKRKGSKYVRINEGMHKRRSPMNMIWIDFIKFHKDFWKWFMSLRPRKRRNATSTAAIYQRRPPSPLGSGSPMFPPPPPKPRRNIEDEHKLSKEIDDEINDIWESISRKKRTKSILDSINSRRRIDDMWRSLESESHGIFDSQKAITQRKPKGRIIL